MGRRGRPFADHEASLKQVGALFRPRRRIDALIRSAPYRRSTRRINWKVPVLQESRFQAARISGKGSTSPFRVEGAKVRFRRNLAVHARSREGPDSVESRCGAVAVGRTYLLPPLSFGGASLARPWLRFHTPLIEPDMQICRIRLPDKTSRLHPRRAPTKPCEAYELEVPVKVGIG